MTTRRLVTSTLLAVSLAGGFVRGSDGPKPASTPGPGEPTLSEVRHLTERFRDVNVALAEGYIRDPFDMCETAEMMGRPAALGAMGIHFFRPDLLGITKPPSPRVSGTGTHTDFRQPSILIYEPKANRSLELVAVENLVFADAWRAAGHTERPTFHGVPYDAMADDLEHRTRRGTYVRAALRPACLDLSRESERRVHAAESGGHVCGAPGQDSFSSRRHPLNARSASTSNPCSPRPVPPVGLRPTDCRAETWNSDQVADRIDAHSLM